MILQKPIVLFRSAGGKATALEDRCAHRNAPLSRGRVRRDLLECAYHGWCYAADGTVAAIPALPEGSSLPNNLAIPCYPCVEQDGYVWICPSGKPITDRPDSFPHLGERGWTSFHMQTHFPASVEACLENFLDCPHAAHVHRLWFRYPTSRAVHAIVRTLPDGAEAEYFEEPRKTSLVWWLLAPKRTEMKHTDRYIAPSTSRVDYIFSEGSHYIITSLCTPISDTETEVYTVITFRFGRIGPLVRLFFEPLSRIIIRQDVRILSNQQSNITRFGRPSFKVIPTDLLGPHIMSWRQALKGGSTPPSAGLEQHVDLQL